MNAKSDEATEAASTAAKPLERKFPVVKRYRRSDGPLTRLYHESAIAADLIVDELHGSDPALTFGGQHRRAISRE
jgi:hypothetical protein